MGKKLEAEWNGGTWKSTVWGSQTYWGGQLGCEFLISMVPTVPWETSKNAGSD